MPPGRVLLDLRGSRRYYAATAVDQGFRLRFFGSCDVDLDPILTRATVHPMPGADPDLLSVLVSGTLLAFVLTMRGETVLHASAVQVGDAAVAFVGASGMGKSTMATLLCADGARLVTDDVLRLDTTSSPPTCALGATELRLRKGADHLSERFAHRRGVPRRSARPAMPARRSPRRRRRRRTFRSRRCSFPCPITRPAPHHRGHAAVAERRRCWSSLSSHACWDGRTPRSAGRASTGSRRSSTGCRSTPPRCRGVLRSRTTSP